VSEFGKTGDATHTNEINRGSMRAERVRDWRQSEQTGCALSSVNEDGAAVLASGKPSLRPPIAKATGPCASGPLRGKGLARSCGAAGIIEDARRGARH